MILELINGPEDIKKLSSEELDILRQEIRNFLIGKISATGEMCIRDRSVDSLEYGDYQVKYDFSEAGKQKVTVVYSYFTEDNEEKELEDTVSVYVLDETKDYYDCGIEITKEPNTKAVSYTHLDVYKRQAESSD